MQTSFIFILLFSTGIQCFAQKENAAELHSDTVYIRGLVDSPYIITKDNLSAFTIQEGENYNITNHKGEVKSKIASYKGILLADILTKAKINISNPKERGKYFITISGVDGYTALFALNELLFGPAGKNTWLIVEENGKPIIGEGLFVLGCTSDLITGPRHVKWVSKIEVKRVE